MSDQPSEELQQLRIRADILAFTRSDMVYRADALQKTAHAKHRDPLFVEILNKLDTEIAGVSARIKRIEAVGR